MVIATSCPFFERLLGHPDSRRVGDLHLDRAHRTGRPVPPSRCFWLGESDVGGIHRDPSLDRRVGYLIFTHAGWPSEGSRNARRYRRSLTSTSARPPGQVARPARSRRPSRRSPRLSSTRSRPRRSVSASVSRSPPARRSSAESLGTALVLVRDLSSSRNGGLAVVCKDARRYSWNTIRAATLPDSTSAIASLT
jgi:hypothetical protein